MKIYPGQVTAFSGSGAAIMKSASDAWKRPSSFAQHLK
jgi:hypothetical protein